MKKKIFTLQVLTFAIALNAQVTPSLWSEYVANPNAHPNIPNCSYAGYKYGDSSIPEGNGKVFNVKNAPYSALGDNSTDDTEAIRKALKDAEAAGGGIVYLPNGEYKCSGVLFINGDNVILKGESQDKTIIHFTKSLTDGYAPNYTTSGGNVDQIMWSWAGGNIWITPKSKNTYLEGKPTNINDTWLKGYDTYMADKEAWNVEEKLADITSNEDRGSFSFSVNDGSKIKESDYIAIRYKNSDDWSLMKYFTGDGNFANNYIWNSGTGWINPRNREFVDWVVQVDKVNGNTVTLKQPLRVPLRKEWAPQIMAMGDLIQESGVENLTILLEKDYESQYDNSSWRNANHNREKGWNGVYFNNAVNCFAKDITIYDSEMGAGTAASKNITLTGIKIHGKNKKRSSHHGLTCRRQSQDILFENFELLNYDQFDHGINVEDFSMGNVWHSGIVMKGCFDTHRLVPAECIRTNIKVNVGGGYGGAGEAGPQIGARFVHWNVELKGETNNTITPATTMPMGALVGIIGDRPSSSESSGCIVEASNLSVVPSDLYIGQKELRNGILQSTATKTPWATWEIPARIEAEDGQISNINITTGTSDDGSDRYLNSFNSLLNVADYNINVPVSGRYPVRFRVSSEDSGENCLAIYENGAEVGKISFNGSGKGNWRTVESSLLLNPGQHTLQLKGVKGKACLNYFTIESPSETSETPFPVFETLPGNYNGFVSVGINQPENTEVFYRIEGQGSTFNKYSGKPIELTQTSKVIATARKKGVMSLENAASYEIIPPIEVPCKILAIDYTDQNGMSEQAASPNSQLSVGQAGDWATYMITVPETGLYQINVRISIKLRDGVTSTGFDLYVNDKKVSSFANLPDMGGNWDRFKVFPTNLKMNKGVNEIKVVALDKRFNFDWIEVFKADPVKVPGEIEAENYNADSYGYGLHRAVNTSEGRKDGYEVALQSNSKLGFPIEVPYTGVYPIEIISCSKSTNSQVKFSIKETGEIIGSVNLNQSGGAQYETKSNLDLTLPKGKYTLFLEQTSGSEQYIDRIIISDPTSIDMDDEGIVSEDPDNGEEEPEDGEEEPEPEIPDNPSDPNESDDSNGIVQISLPDSGENPYYNPPFIYVWNKTPMNYRIFSLGGEIINNGVCTVEKPVDVSFLKKGVFVFLLTNGQYLKIVK